MTTPALAASSAARAKLHKDSMKRVQEHTANFPPGVNEAWRESQELYDRRYEERVRKSTKERNREVDALVQRQLGYSDGAGAATGCALMLGALV